MFYWFGAYYSATLFVQTIVMILVQVLLLKVALDNRPSPGGKNSVEHAPFSSMESGFSRPYDFWQWKSSKPYVLLHSLRLIHKRCLSSTDPVVNMFHR